MGNYFFTAGTQLGEVLQKCSQFKGVMCEFGCFESESESSYIESKSIFFLDLNSESTRNLNSNTTEKVLNLDLNMNLDSDSHIADSNTGQICV